MACCALDARIIYKKTDSTLRGNIGSELRALSSKYPDARIAYVPAYPALGRTVKRGCLYVWGTPVHQTEFAADALNPIASSTIADLLPDNLPCIVYNGKTVGDVAQATAVALADTRCRIIAGPASVAAEIVAQMDIPRRPVAPSPVVRKCLIVNGSRHPVSLRQIAFAEVEGCASAASGSPWRIFRPVMPLGMSPLEVAAETGSLVRQCLEKSELDALVVFGGDTAFGILEALGRPLLEPLGEVLRGVPVTRIVGRGLYLITKASGFGDDQLLPRMKRILNAN